MKAPATLQSPVQYMPASLYNTDQNQYLAVPAFTIDIPSWPGASYITHIISLPAADFQLLKPIADNAFYVLAVMWYSERSGVHRYKLWSTGTEVLSYPLYDNQVIPANTFLEVWCCSNGLNVEVPAQNLLIDPIASTSAESISTSVCSIGDLTTLDEMFLTCRS